MKRATRRAATRRPHAPVPRWRRNCDSAAIRRGVLRVLPLWEIGCVFALVLVSALVLIATGNVDEAVFSEMAPPVSEPPWPLSRMAVGNSAGTVLLRTSDHQLRFLELRTGEALDLPGLQTVDVTAISQSDDGGALAVGYADGSVCFRTTGSSGARLSRIISHSERVSDLCLSADGRRAVSSSGDGRVLIWDVARAEVVQRLTMPASPGNGGVVAEFSPDAAIVAGATRDGVICCWRTSNGHLLKRMPLSGVCSLAFSRDSRRLVAVSTHAKSIHCFDVSSGREEWVHRHPLLNGAYFCIAAALDGRTLAAGDLDGDIEVLDIASGAHRRRIPAHNASVSCLRYSPDGRLLFSTSHDGTMAVWQTNGLTELHARIGPWPAEGEARSQRELDHRRSHR